MVTSEDIGVKGTGKSSRDRVRKPKHYGSEDKRNIESTERMSKRNDKEETISRFNNFLGSEPKIIRTVIYCRNTLPTLNMRSVLRKDRSLCVLHGRLNNFDL